MIGGARDGGGRSEDDGAADVASTTAAAASDAGSAAGNAARGGPLVRPKYTPGSPSDVPKHCSPQGVGIGVRTQGSIRHDHHTEFASSLDAEQDRRGEHDGRHDVKIPDLLQTTLNRFFGPVVSAFK